MIIRAKTFKAWMKANLEKDTIKDLAEHGAMGGFPGLTYYRDTEALYDKFEAEIWDKLDDDAEVMGEKNVLAFIASFNGAENVFNSDQFKNLLVWWMAEETARELTEE